MKKLVLAVLVGSLALATSAHATEWKVGPEIGLSVSNISVDAGNGVSVDFDSRTGIDVGVSAEGHIMDWFYVQPELRYVQKGASIPGSLLSTGSDVDLHADYLSIPVLAKAKFQAGAVAPYLLFGPDFSFKVNSAAAANGTSVHVSGLHTFDFGLDFGAGVETALAAGIVGYFDVRYELGLTNMDADSSDTGSLKNRSWQFLVGVRF